MSILERWASDWLAWLATQNRRRLTLVSYRQDLKGLDTYLASMGIEDLVQVTTPLLRRFLVHLSHERGLAPSSVHRAYHAIKNFFDYLVDEEVIAHNPLRKVPAPKRPRKNPPNHLTPQEVRLCAGIEKLTTIGAEKLTTPA